MFLEGRRFLVLADAGTGLVGVAAVDGHTDRTQSDCLAFFKQLAVTEASPVVVEMLTDSDAMLGNLLRRLGLPLQVKTAGPQAHETVGLAERNVRRFKEMVSCLRSDLRAHRFDLTCSGECLRFALNYVAQTHNHFGVGSASGHSEGLSSRRTPIELVLQKERPSPTCSMFASVVRAKVPESLAASVPEATRFVPAAYLHIRPNTLVHVVSSKMGDRVHIFQAEVKPLSQIVWDTSLAPDVIKVASDVDAAAPPHEPSRPSRPAQPQDSEVGIREGLPLNGPPRAWVREHGPTPDCSACNSQSRHGRKHMHPAAADIGTG